MIAVYVLEQVRSFADHFPIRQMFHFDIDRKHTSEIDLDQRLVLESKRRDRPHRALTFPTIGIVNNSVFESLPRSRCAVDTASRDETASNGKLKLWF
jgi:hypothetical protein